MKSNRDFINVIDIAEANLKSMESKDANDGIIINIGSEVIYQ